MEHFMQFQNRYVCLYSIYELSMNFKLFRPILSRLFVQLPMAVAIVAPHFLRLCIMWQMMITDAQC